MCRSSEAELGGGGAGVGGGKAGGVRLRFLAWVSSLKSSAPKFGLFVFFVVYIAAGAKIFQVLEHPAEVKTHEDAGSALVSQRSAFLQTLTNMSALPPKEYEARLSKALQVYEGAVEDAVGAGVSPLDPDLPNYHWSYIKSVFFASTVITTIGYGNTAPVTTWGRFFCILFGFVGIPVTITVIADLGTMFANMVSALARYLASFTKTCRPFKKLRAPVLQKGSRWLMVLGSIGALLVYIAIGGVLFIQWENWTFFEAFYFCFITMTTIGLGDFVPVRTEFMLVCTLYILVGLALTSTIIELVRRQYAESWQQFKELSGRLGELSGPLADQLKRLGEQAGDISIDVHLMKDLKELRNALQLSTRLEAISRMDPKLRSDAKLVELLKAHLNGQENSEDALSEKEPLQPEANKRKVIQVVIYESSV